MKELLKREEYKQSTFFNKLQRQKNKHIFRDKTVIAFTDIDGTYISTFKPNNLEKIKNFTPYPAIIEFQRMRFTQASDALTQYLNTYSIPIIAITGRNFLEVRNGQADGEKYQDEHLPYFDIIASSIGTQVYVYQSGAVKRYIKDEFFEQNIARNSGYKRIEIYPLCTELKESMSLKFPTLDFVFQPIDQATNLFKYNTERTIKYEEDPYKISFMCKKDVISRRTLETLLKNWFISHGKSFVEIIISTADDGGFFIDIVPFGKDRVIKYLMNLTLADVGIVAGDSGNDKLMILNAPSAAVVAGGSKQEDLIAEIASVPRIKSMEYYYMLPNGVPIYVEPREAKYNQYLGPESLQMAFATYLSHLIAYQRPFA